MVNLLVVLTVLALSLKQGYAQGLSGFVLAFIMRRIPMKNNSNTKLVWRTKCYSAVRQYRDAIRCYICSSEKDPSCRDPFTKSHHDHKLTECTQESMRNIHEIIPGIFSQYSYHNSQPNDFQCVKAVTREHDREIVVRSCTVPRTDTFDVCSQLKSRNLAYCQSCRDNACNGSGVVGPSGLLAGALLLFLALAHLSN